MIERQPVQSDTEKTLIGNANELAVLIALTDHSIALNHALVARPALPFEDQPEYSDPKNPVVGIDIVLEGMQGSRIEVQIKTTSDKSVQQRYLEAGIKVISTSEIVKILQANGRIAANNNHKVQLYSIIDSEDIEAEVRRIVIDQLGLK